VRALSVLTLVVCLVAAVAATQSVQTRPPQGASASAADDIAALGSPDPIVRAFAACQLAQRRYDSAPALAALVRMLPDATPIDPVFCGRDEYGSITMLMSRRSAPGLEAARALSSIGDAGIAALVNGARSADAATRRHAVHGLTYVADSRTDAVFIAVSADPDPQVRRDAAAGLGRSRDAAAVEALIRRLQDADPAVREAAARSLGRTAHRR
jgi:HEAT repeat protein